MPGLVRNPHLPDLGRPPAVEWQPDRGDLAQRSPGPLVGSQDELVAAVLDEGVPAQYAERYAAWRRQFNARDDGRAAERVVDRILDQGFLTA